MTFLQCKQGEENALLALVIFIDIMKKNAFS